MRARKLAIADYGMGNLHSVFRALQAAAPDDDVYIAASAADIQRADRLILPGQGAMADCMRNLHQSGLTQALIEAARTRPLMGVCVGFQMLFDYSEEGGSQALGLIPGAVRKFSGPAFRPASEGGSLKVPHMGWNQVQHREHPLWQDIEQNAYFYFVHSYYAEPARQQDSCAAVQYGGRFCCAVQQGNVFAVQFHPEKSARQGLQLYRNFVNWRP